MVSGRTRSLRPFVAVACTAVLLMVSADAIAQNTWSPTASMGIARQDHTATLLPDGRVLVAGGSDPGGTLIVHRSAEIYAPASGTWSPTDSIRRQKHTATLLPDGRVLVAGGAINVHFPLEAAEIYDPATDTWSSTASMATGRYYHTATLLPNGRVLVAGGGRVETCCPLLQVSRLNP